MKDKKRDNSLFFAYFLLEVYMKKIFFIICCFFICSNFVSAKEENNNLSPKAKSAIMIETSTGEVLYEYNADEKLAPASMTKMMSLLLIMEALDNNVIKYTDMVTISDKASSMGGSQILLETGESMSVDDLLKGITVASGNDAVVALAEKIGGTEENFVKMMNDKAKELGLKNTNFKNCHGLDDKDHYSSARDMSIIAKELVKHQKILDYSSIYETYLRKGTKKEIWLVNTNKLVRFKQGVDGLKTGYTENSGYCLTATMKQGDMRVIAVTMGEPDSNTRNNEISGMLDYAFAQYSIDTIYKKDDIVDNIKLDKSNIDSVDIVPLEDIKILYKKIDGKKDIKYEIKYNKISPKMNTGDVIGYMIIKDGDKEIKKVNVTVNKNVNKSSYIDLLSKNMRNIVTGNIKI